MKYTEKNVFIYLIATLLLTCNAKAICVNLEVEEHKKAFLAQLAYDPKINDPDYQYSRATAIINLTDVDDIPKISNAGEIVVIDNSECQIMHNGIKIHKGSYYEVEWLTDVIYALKGHHEPQEEKAFYEVLKFIPKGGVMLELGSYWAYYSLWFATQIQDSKNFLIEPSLKRLSVGQANFLLNNKNGFFFQGYAGGKYDSQELFEGDVQYFPIDSFLVANGIEHVNILHADIQFAEFDMLKTCQKSINQKMIDFFFISTHSDELHHQCLEFLNNNGFDILAQHLPPLMFFGDGLIVAKRKGIFGPNPMHVSTYGR